MKKKPLHYEVARHPEGGYAVIVWESNEKHRVVASKALPSYREATQWGRAVKNGKTIKIGETQ